MKDEFILDLSKTYIYHGEEYILTGRSAEKEPDVQPEPRRERKSSRRTRRQSEPDVMVEIKPSPRSSLRGASVPAPSMAKELQWVKVSDLYVVVDKIADDYFNEDEGEDNESDDSSG